jgi:hypothetical protein
MSANPLDEDLLNEDLISFKVAARELGDTHYSSVARWARNGINGVVLESVLVGGKRRTSRQAVRRFITKVNAAADGNVMPAKSSRRRQREIEWAERVLDGLGIGAGRAVNKLKRNRG